MLATCLLAASLAGPYDAIVRSASSAGVMQLGSLYHAGAEQPVAGVICAPELLLNHTSVEKGGKFVSKYASDDRFSSKAKLVDVEVHVALRASLGPAKVTVSLGLGFLSDKRTSVHQIRTSWSTEVRTEVEFLDVMAPEVVDAAWEDARQLSKATHVVTGVVWGQRNVGVFESTATSSQNIMQLKLMMKAEVEVLGATATLIDLKLEAGLRKKSESYTQSVKLFSDYVPERYPSSQNELIDAIISAVETLNETDSRGVPLSYVLTPLSVVRPSAAAVLMWDIGAESLAEAQRVLDELEESGTVVEDLHSVDSQGHAVWADAVDRYRRAFRTWAAAYAERMDRAMTAVRMNDISAAGSLHAVLNDYSDSPYTAEKVEVRVHALRAEIERYHGYLAVLRSKNVQVATSGADIRSAGAESSRTRRAYLLLLVDNGGRDDVRTMHRFANYAGRLGSNGGKRCIERINADGSRFCHASMSMLAAHFDSYCNYLCDAAFCPLQSAPIATRACRSVRAGGECTADAAAEGCWQRPAPDAYNTSTELDALPGMAGAITPEWCSCPYTIVIDLKAGTRVDLPALPGTPRIVEVAAGPVGNSALLTIAPAEAGDAVGEAAIRGYRVAVRYDRADAAFEKVTGREVLDVVREFDTAGDGTDILVLDLEPGRRYWFAAAAMNAIGVGEASEPVGAPGGGAFLIPYVGSTVAFIGGPQRALAGAPEGAARAGEHAGVPSWAVAGASGLRVRVRTSAQLRRPVASVRFVNSSGGGAFDCEDVEEADLESAVCTIPTAAVLVDLAADAALRVEIAGAAAHFSAEAEGTAVLLAPTAAVCAAIEAPDRALLCEARLAEPTPVPDKADPLNQAVVLQVHTGRYLREGLSGWRIEVEAVGAAGVAAQYDFGVVSAARVGGLTAGVAYRFFLSARRPDGTVSRRASGVPADGYQAASVMPIVVHGGSPRNRIPGWRSFGDGHFAVQVSLSVPSASPIARLDFEDAAGGRLRVHVHDATADDTATRAAALPLHSLNAAGAFRERVPVEAFDAYGEVLARGEMVREPISGAACQEWSPDAPLHCYLPAAGISRCVRTCGDCVSPAGATVQVAEQCRLDVCAADEILCIEAKDPARPCYKRATTQVPCARCYDASATTVHGVEACRPPCQPMPGILVAAGTDAELVCPAGAIYDSGSAPTPITFHCPLDNTQRLPTHPGVGAAVWAAGLEVPACSQCSVERHCSGKALAAVPNTNRTGCVCTCMKGYTTETCAMCDADDGYVRSPPTGACVPFHPE